MKRCLLASDTKEQKAQHLGSQLTNELNNNSSAANPLTQLIHRYHFLCAVPAVKGDFAAVARRRKAPAVINSIMSINLLV
jgi:hypothetical protein